MLLDAVLGAGLQLVEVPASFGNADDRHIKVAPFDHGMQAGKIFL
jgi:hypothetical protein